MTVPGTPALEAFLSDVTTTVRHTLGADLVALYLVGSFAIGDPVAATSDVDLLAVADRVAPGRRDRLAAELVRLAGDCPLAGIEFVLYRAEVVRAPTYPLEYELNLNAGPRIDRLVSTGGDPPHWFLLDLDIARTCAVACWGPPSGALLGAPTDRDVRAAIIDSLRWHRQYATASADAVLNACRGWRRLAAGDWVDQTIAGRWARRHLDHVVIEAALEGRARGRQVQLPDGAVAAFLDAVEERVALHSRGGPPSLCDDPSRCDAHDEW